jgi:hypothetical protein
LDDASGKGAADHSRLSRTYRGVRRIEIGVVERVEPLAAKVQAEPLPDGEVADQPEIHVEVGGSGQDTRAGIAEGELGRRDKRSRIKPVINGLLARRKVSASYSIRTLRSAASRI